MIGIKLKRFQEQAVDFLFDKTTDSNSKPKIVLQSPTGSGKTIILLAYIEKYLQYNDNDIICWLSPGKGDLEEQSKQKMSKLLPSLKSGSLFDILHRGFESATTYFINWETITKKDNTALRESERKNLFERIAEAHNQQKRFIIIIDEEHQNNTSKADDIISSLNAKYEIRVSATPGKRLGAEQYEINEIDVINEELITRFMYINKDLDNINIFDSKSEADILLEKADEVRKQIAQGYSEVNENIRPLVLVQFPNLNDELIEYVEQKLNSMGYTYENKLLASWFSPESKQDKDAKSKKLGKINIGTNQEDSITNNDASPVFLLFKQALATGWDCPRAKILVKLRENMSETFEIQTLGRLRRMPKARHYDNDLLNCSYLYTFDDKYKLEVIKSGAGAPTQRLFLKEEAKSIKLIKQTGNNDVSYADPILIRKVLYDGIKNKYNLVEDKAQNQKILENNGYIFGTSIINEFLKGKYVTLSEIGNNQILTSQINVEVNTHVHGIEKQNRVDRIKKIIGLNYENTNIILATFFVRDYGNPDFKFLNLNNKQFYAFIINNFDKLNALMLEFTGFTGDYAPILDIKEVEFKIPLDEHFSFIPFETNTEIMHKNVYKDYNFSMISEQFRSKSERLFERFCEQNDSIDLVYKNGDSGKQYLSIVYTTGLGKNRLFYPDYVVKTKEGKIWLIETKGGEYKGESKDIDLQSGNKFKALKDFCQQHSYNFGFVRDKNDSLLINTVEYTDSLDTPNWIPIENNKW
ncbi:DEAD/DEAH box helicase family protein [Mycoplasma simbae]|uniref:DEAD/DEAH box helicase family protein n=1 Tax=Mycoplasma simbae TaxID=36744 RepID=UPI00049620A6|nr:DEAD/DEAH box helicase family protein [Mycoplasma simbae]